MDDIHAEQIRWAKMLRKATSPPEIELTELAREPLMCDQQDLVGPAASEVKPISNGFGECKACRKQRRLWAGICAWCGADPDDFEGEG